MFYGSKKRNKKSLKPEKITCKYSHGAKKVKRLVGHRAEKKISVEKRKRPL